MQHDQANEPRNSRLRIVFPESVVSLRFSAEATFGDIAGALGDLSDQGYGNPVAIDVTFLTKPPLSFPAYAH